MSATNVLVTGGTGFIGSRLVGRLVERGHRVRCLVCVSSKVTDLAKLDVELTTGDIRDRDAVRAAARGCETLFHLAGNAHPSAVTPYRTYAEMNVEGTRNVLDGAAASGRFAHLVVASSIAATGPSRDGAGFRWSSCARPWCTGSATGNGSGVRDDREWGMPWLGVPMPGDHENLFDFCYVDNLVGGLMLAARSERAQGQTYFLSDERPYRIREIIDAVAGALGTPAPERFWPVWLEKGVAALLDAVGFVTRQDMPLSRHAVRWMTSSYWVCDISKARTDLGYAPAIPLREGVRRTIDWARSAGLFPQASTRG